MNVPARLSIVTLAVADVARSTAFYEALGWRRRPESQESVTFFDNAGSMLALFGTDDLAHDAGLVGAAPHDPDRLRGASYAVNLDSDEEVRALLALAEDAGATITRPAQQSPFYDGQYGYFLDPDGHAWEVAHNPAFDFLPR